MNKRHTILHAALPCLLALTIAAPVYAAGSEAVRLSDPIEVTDSYEAFGSPLPAHEGMLGVGELLANSEQYQGQEVVVSTRIAKVCQKKGCFFVANEGADSVRISFKDYSFFIPTDSGGKQVILAGVFERKPLSENKAKHLAEDLGEEAPVNAPAFEYSIVATGVRIGKG